MLAQPSTDHAEDPQQDALALRRERRQALLSLALTVALTLGLALLPFDISALGSYGYLGLFVVAMLASATVVLPSPALGVGLLAGKALNPWIAGAWMGLGAGLGEITGYLAGRAGASLAQRSRWYVRIAGAVERYGTLTVFVLAAVPSPLLDLAGIAAGTMRMPLWRFWIACIAGKVVRFMLVARLGQLLFSSGIL